MFGAIFCSNVKNSVFIRANAVKVLLQSRNKMKSHHAAAKRFIKIGNGYKRKQAGRKHGNGRFSSSSLSHLDSFVPVTSKANHLKKLTRYLKV